MKKINVNSCWTDLDKWGENILWNDECRTLSIIDIEIDVDRFLSLWSFVIYLVVMIEEYYARYVNVDTWYAPADYLKKSLI